MDHIKSDSELSDEFNHLIAEMKVEWTNEITTSDMELFRDIMCREPVEPELKANTYSQEQDSREELESIIAKIRNQDEEEFNTIDNDVLKQILFHEPVELNTYPQPAESQDGGHDWWDTVQPVPLYSQPGAYSQEQYNNVPIVKLPDGQNLHYACILNGQQVYIIQPEILTPPVSAPAPTTSNSIKRKRESTLEDDRQYVKKPPNAFMLFMKEQRAIVEAEMNTRGSAAVNTVLGQRWKLLTKEEQAKYYEQAQKLKQLHLQQHPEWSIKNNYGKKKKRIRRKTNVPMAEESAFRPDEPLVHLYQMSYQTQMDEVPSCFWHNAPNTAQTPLPYPAAQTQTQGPVMEQTEMMH